MVIWNEFNIYEGVEVKFRKGLILYLPLPYKNNPHYYVFLTDLLEYVDQDGKKKKAYLLMNISTDINKWKDTYDFKVGKPDNYYLHSKFINRPGVMVYERAVLFPARHIKKIAIEDLEFESNTLVHVDKILSKIPDSKAPPYVKSFYDQNFGNNTSTTSTTLNKSKKSRSNRKSKKSKIRELLDNPPKYTLISRLMNRPRKRTLISELFSRSKRNRQIRESYRDYY